MEYAISVKGERKHIVEAESYEEAAQKGSKLLNKGRVVAIRVTGDHGKSGVFQGYRSRGDAQTTEGPQFHVFQL